MNTSGRRQCAFFSAVLFAVVMLISGAYGQQYEDQILLPPGVVGNDNFGHPLSVWENVAILGAVGDDTMGSLAGAAYIYRFDVVSGLWIEETKLLDSGGVAGDYFGQAVAICGDVAVVGAFGDGTKGYQAGAAHIFRYDQGTNTWNQGVKLIGSNVTAGDNFGHNVSIYDDVILIGANSDDINGNNSGAVYVFRDGTGGWTEEAYLHPSDGAAGDYFGRRTSVHDGVALISSYEDDVGGLSNVGSAYVFRYDPVTPKWVEEKKLLASDGAVDDFFGRAVSIWGDRALVGSYRDDDNYSNSGSAYEFRYDAGSGWTEVNKLLASNCVQDAEFGTSLALHEDTAVVGAWKEDGIGAAYYFQHDSKTGVLVESERLLGGNSQAGDLFGSWVAVFREKALVAAYYHDGQGPDSGAAYYFELDIVHDPITILVPGDYLTIQQALDASREGDTILVAPDAYYENLSFPSWDIVLKSELGAFYTIIDGMSNGSVVTFVDGAGNGSLLSGFTITNGHSQDGGGVYLDDASLILENNLIVHNRATRYGGGVRCEDYSTVMLANNTIVGNQADFGGGLYGGEYSYSTVVNSIFWGNSAPQGYEIYVGIGTVEVLYSDVDGGEADVSNVSGGTLIWGQGNIDDNPKFVAAAFGDFHIEFNSPCKNAGDPNSIHPDFDLEGDPRIADGVIDMGADEFHLHLYCLDAIIPGNQVQIKVVGPPGEPVTLLLAANLQDPAHPTYFGDLFLETPFVYEGFIGSIKANGSMSLERTVPGGWQPGDKYYLQALVGYWYNKTTKLTNLCTLHVK